MPKLRAITRDAYVVWLFFSLVLLILSGMEVVDAGDGKEQYSEKKRKTKLESQGYQIWLVMVLHWHTTCPGSAIIPHFHASCMVNKSYYVADCAIFQSYCNVGYILQFTEETVAFIHENSPVQFQLINRLQYYMRYLLQIVSKLRFC